MNMKLKLLALLSTPFLVFALATPAQAQSRHYRHDRGHDRSHDRGHDYRRHDGRRHDDRRYSRTRVVHYRPAPPPRVVHYRPAPRVVYRPAPRPYWVRGGRYYGAGYAPTYVVNDWGHYGLRSPPRGYYWRRSDTGEFLLVALATGIITDIILNH